MSQPYGSDTVSCSHHLSTGKPELCVIYIYLHSLQAFQTSLIVTFQSCIKSCVYGMSLHFLMLLTGKFLCILLLYLHSIFCFHISTITVSPSTIFALSHSHTVIVLFRFYHRYLSVTVCHSLPSKFIYFFVFHFQFFILTHTAAYHTIIFTTFLIHYYLSSHLLHTYA